RGRGTRPRPEPRRAERLRRKPGRTLALPLARLRRDGGMDEEADQRDAGLGTAPRPSGATCRRGALRLASASRAAVATTSQRTAVNEPVASRTAPKRNGARDERLYPTPSIIPAIGATSLAP